MARSRQSEGNAIEAGEGQDSPPSPKTQAASLSFEAALTSLEGVVARLESGDMPLEQALEAFEAGVALSRRCAATLDAAERRIEILMAERVGGGASGRVEAFEDSIENELEDEPEEESGAEDPVGEE